MASQIPLDISAIYLDNNYAQISFTTFTVVNPNYYYRAVAYDSSGNYYETRGLKSPITITGLKERTNYSCFVELVQYSTSTFVSNKTLPWPKIYSISLSDVSYSSLKVSWTGVDISYLTVTRSVGAAAPIDISTTAQYITSYSDTDLSGNTLYYYYVTPFSTYSGKLNTGTKSATVSAKTLPAPPTNVSMAFYDSSSVRVAFTPARNSYNNSYYYILRATDTLGRIIDTSGVASPIQNSDLSGNTKYTMRVIASIDNSLNATSITAVSATTLVRPPTDVSVAFFDASAIRLTYAAGKNTYSSLYYTVYVRDAPRNYYTTVSGGTAALTISNLSGNTSYTLSVSNTLNGNAALSATTVYGTQLTLVQPPVAPYQTFVDSSSVTVAYGAGKNTYTSVLYTATATPPDGGAAKQGTSAVTRVTVADLSGNTKYTVGVAVTLDGNAAITAAAVTNVATRTYVQPPTNLVSAYDNNSVTVSFTLPRNSYATSSYYTAYITDGSSVITETSNNNIILFRGLKSGVTYSYYVNTVLTAKSVVGSVATYNPYPVVSTFTLTDYSYNYVNLSWTGRDISYVRVARTIGVAEVVDICGADYASPYYDSDVSGNTVYSYYITPVRNYKGILKVGAVSSTLYTKTPVSPPKDLSAIYYDVSAITLTFNGQKNSYTKFYYVARATNTTTGAYRDVSGVSSPITITNLNGGARYTCTVRIVIDDSQNLVGTSAPITVYTNLSSNINYIALVRYT